MPEVYHPRGARDGAEGWGGLRAVNTARQSRAIPLAGWLAGWRGHLLMMNVTWAGEGCCAQGGKGGK